MNNSYITIIKEKRTVLSRKRVPLNQNECTADFRIGVPFEQNLQEFLLRLLNKRIPLCNVTKKTLKNCISTILQGQILRLDTLGLVGYFTSLEDISLCPLTILS